MGTCHIQTIISFGFTLFLLFLLNQAIGQERNIFATKQGSMRLLLQKKKLDTGISVQTNSLNVRFNYDVPKIRFRAPLSEFESVDSAYQRAVKRIANPDMRFTGEMELRSLKDERYPEVVFPIEGYLTINGQKEFVKLSGNLFPLQHANNYQAQLRVRSVLKLSQFGLKQYLPDFRDRFHIIINQSVLRPRK